VSFRQPKKRPDQQPSSSNEEAESAAEARKIKQSNMNKRYRYGGFNYHHKMNASFQNDPRLDLMVEDWFFEKNVLDIGCNAGQLTLSIARTFRPSRVLGIDIDPVLISAARKNIRHFQDKDLKVSKNFLFNIIIHIFSDRWQISGIFCIEFWANYNSGHFNVTKLSRQCVVPPRKLCTGE
jgi:SAM-dependent methyltransferase